MCLFLVTSTKQRIPAVASSNGSDFVKRVTSMIIAGKGDLFYDELVLGVLRNAEVKYWVGDSLLSRTGDPIQGEFSTFHLPPKIPCRLLVTTSEQKQFDVRVLSVDPSEGITLEFWPIGRPGFDRLQSVR